jgi:hypothetical protein
MIQVMRVALLCDEFGHWHRKKLPHKELRQQLQINKYIHLRSEAP